MTRSVEHIFSLEPEQTRQFVQHVRDVEKAFGTSRRVLHKEELQKRLRVRRSLHVKDSVKAGQRLSDVAVEFRRPGFGIAPDQYEALLDACFTRSLEAGARVEHRDLTPSGA